MFNFLVNSVFLQVLGSAIVTSFWHTFILWFLYKIITISFPKLNPAANYNLGVIFIFAGFGSFLFSIFKNTFASPSALNESGVSIFHPSSPYFSFQISTNVYTSLSVAYLVLLAFLSARSYYSLKNTFLLYMKRSKPADEKISSFVNKTAALLRIRRKVTAWVCDHVTNPSTIGFLKPVILLPAACVTHLSTEQLEAIIVHELSHIKRNDYLINLFLLIIEEFLFFNPFVYLLIKDIHRQREHSCDDLVMKNNYEPLLYANALLTIGKFELNKNQFSMNAVSGKRQLLKRIQRITTGSTFQKQEKFSPRILAYSIAVCSFFCLFSFLPVRHLKDKAVVQPIVTAVEQTHLTIVNEKPVLASEKQITFSEKKKKEFKKNNSLKQVDQYLLPAEESPHQKVITGLSANIPQVPNQPGKEIKVNLNKDYLNELIEHIPSDVQEKLLKNLKEQKSLATIENSLNERNIKKYFQVFETEGRKYQKLLNGFNQVQGARINLDSLASGFSPKGFYFKSPDLKKIQKSLEGIKVEGYPYQPSSGEVTFKFLKIANI